MENTLKDQTFVKKVAEEENEIYTKAKEPDDYISESTDQEIINEDEKVTMEVNHEQSVHTVEQGVLKDERSVKDEQ